jgi:uncharacterized protein (UPF0332 family)
VSGSPFARNLVRKSHRALRSARIILDDGDFDGAANRAYYGMFNIARAVLLTAGVPEDGLPATHQELVAAFRQYAVQSGQIDRELAGALSRAENLRFQADYKGADTDAKAAAESVKRAENFVNTLARMFALQATPQAAPVVDD